MYQALHACSSPSCVYTLVLQYHTKVYCEIQSQSIIPPSGKGFEKQVPTWLCVFLKTRYRADARWK